MSKRALRYSLFALIFWNLSAFAQIIPNRYILILNDPPVAERFVSRARLQTAAAEGYRRQLDTTQAQVKTQLAARNFQVVGSVSEVLNAVFVVADPSRLAELESIPGVAAVRPSYKMKLLLNRATALSNAPGAWTAVGGQANAGKGIKIAIIDTGVDQTHPALQDSSLSYPTGFPKGDSNYTNTKVIVARSYINMLSDTNPTDSTPDDFTARDHQGHGTFVAVVAAGNQVANTPAGLAISGMAPKAWIGSYKVCGTPAVTDCGALGSQAVIQAVNDAVKDGMDVITCSIGGLAMTDWATDPTATAFQNATKSAVVVASAANSGLDGYNYPSFNTIGSPSNAPDVISVGATLSSHVLLPTVSMNASSAPSTLKNVTAAMGDSFFYPSAYGSNTAPLIDVATVGKDGTACAALPANSLTGSYALILRTSNAATGCTFDTKALNAQNAGAIGFVFYNDQSGTPINPEGIFENGPSVMISDVAGAALKSYVGSNPGALVTIDLAGAEQEVAAWSSQWGFSPALAANQLASYSSLGPTPEGLLKPDMVAPAGLDPAMSPDGDIYPPSGLYSAAQNYDPTGVLFSTNRYAAADGTSFSAPLVAGAAALIKQAHSSLTPTQIKSLLVDYAAQDTTTDDGVLGTLTPVDAESIGGGRLNAQASIGGPVTAEPSTISFGILNSATFPITKTITLTNVSSAAVTLTASANCCWVNGSPNGKLTNATLAVSPTSVSLAAGATATLTVTLSGTAPPASEYSGQVVLQNSATTMRIPFMMLEGSGTVFNLLQVGPLVTSEGIPGQDIGPTTIQLTDSYGVPVANSNVVFSVSPRNYVTFKSATGHPACSPATATTTISCPTDKFGYAYVDIVLGSNISSPLISFSASGLTGSFTDSAGNSFFNIQAAPVVASGGVVDATSFSKAPVAPGSYVNIYGTGLSNYTDTNDPTLDSLAANGTYSILPLEIDNVIVSFDIPASNISLPAHLTYVSPTVVQIQVPWELQGKSSAQMKVVLDADLFGNVVSVPLNDFAPQFFTNGNNVADALDLKFNLISSSSPAKRGDFVQFYANGLGPVNNQPASGAPAVDATSTTKQQVTVSFGGQTATASFAGLAPGFPGLYQINVQVPQNVTPGTAVPVTITVGGVTSAQATLPIQ